MPGMAYFLHTNWKGGFRMAKRKAYLFFNCDGNKSAASMNPIYNHEAFGDTKTGRRALLKKVSEEIDSGRIQLADKTSKEAIAKEILDGNPIAISDMIVFGVVIEAELY